MPLFLQILSPEDVQTEGKQHYINDLSGRPNHGKTPLPLFLQIVSPEDVQIQGKQHYINDLSGRPNHGKTPLQQ